MKKIFFVLLSICFIFLPIRVHAKTLSFEGYYCDPKQDLGDGTFYIMVKMVMLLAKKNIMNNVAIMFVQL